MKRWYQWGMAILFVCCLGSTTWSQTVLVNADVLNVRHQPKGKKIGRVYNGEQFRLLEEKEGWGRIQFRYDRQGWVSLDYVHSLQSKDSDPSIAQFCKRLNQEFAKIHWKDIHCDPEDWQAELDSIQGNPLLYSVIGEQKPTTLLLCSVHSDENTSYQCFRLLKLLQAQPELLEHQLVIAPLVNPDGFFRSKKTRTNARGVDLNRNLPSRDWRELAWKNWKKRYKRNKRRYPGPHANSEPENHFVIQLIQQFQPDKVLSIHAPLNFLDLDYPETPNPKNPSEQGVFRKAKALAVQFSKESRFQFRNYRTFPGSLGRYGDEWKIPIYTIELASADPTKSKKYFERLRQSLVYSFNVILDSQQTAGVDKVSSSSGVN